MSRQCWVVAAVERSVSLADCETAMQVKTSQEAGDQEL